MIAHLILKPLVSALKQFQSLRWASMACEIAEKIQTPSVRELRIHRRWSLLRLDMARGDVVELPLQFLFFTGAFTVAGVATFFFFCNTSQAPTSSKHSRFPLR
ncbi:hypothetical protein U1Q18_051999 [Sarracenia purpurea var. burkii]